MQHTLTGLTNRTEPTKYLCVCACVALVHLPDRNSYGFKNGCLKDGTGKQTSSEIPLHCSNQEKKNNRKKNHTHGKLKKAKMQELSEVLSLS